VAEHTQDRALFHFLHLVGENDSRQLPTSQVLRIEPVAANALEIEQLKLEPNETVIRVSRVRFLNERPVIHETISVPEALFPGLDQMGKELPNSLYAVYERQYGVSVSHAIERLSATAAQDEVARQLDLAPGTPLLSIQRTAYTLNSRPVELRISRCHTQNHHYLLELT